ncbi:MAG: hypothetical protein IT306_10035 [Chloroflexi bacterium]|nr:hypothetical protein [Chloroflexota bacterium]
MRRTAVAVAALLLAAGTTPALAGGGLPKVASIEVGPHRAAVHNDSPSLLTGSNTLTVEIGDLTADHRVSLMLIGPRGEQIAVPLGPVIVLDGPGGGHGGGEASAPNGEDNHASVPADDHAAAPAASSAKADTHGTVARDAHGAAESHGTSVTAPAARDSQGAPVQAKLATAVDSHAASPAAADPHGAGTQDGHATTASSPSPATGHDEAGPAAADADHGHETQEYMARGAVSLPSTGTWTARLVIRDAHGEEMVGEAPVQVEQGGPNRLYLGVSGSLIFGSMLFGMIQRRREPTRSRDPRSRTTR